MRTAQLESSLNPRFYSAIAAGALGYFVDVYDLSVFSISRQQSLLDLGVAKDLSASVGTNLYYWQLIGLAIGGVLWGVMGDKKGRIRILYYSIIFYSVATLLNAYIHTIAQYQLLRFIAGLGLAGELGAGITLISEVMRRNSRGYGAMIVASSGCLGVILAATIEDNFGWRACYQIGGYMGLFILLFRILTSESDIYRQILTHPSRQKGNILYLIKNRRLLFTWLRSILIGTPIYFVLGVLILLAPEFGKVQNLTIKTATATTFFYIANTISDLICPILSQFLGSRKKAIAIFLGIVLVSFIFFFWGPAGSSLAFYWKYSVLGIGIGYWATLLSYVSEQFGTNLRATATTSAPNFIRALAIPLLMTFQFLKSTFAIRTAGFLLGAFTVGIAIVAVLLSKETFNNDLNYQETIP
ncbi:MFS transporter [Puia sp. P3]|uniref:MFS transporter n=1 Tax=Puia sp. P3 TaxID=3423952 RepID=UPI003D671BC9